MGVPKFFRWMSERYPMCSQLIAENKIPEFDNLYLDMNGIIHNCTHKESDSASFRMTEEQMFIAIFNYIEHLFGKIKPKKVFFMAVDGVAPRAKMNQQRSRRFRTAQEAENNIAKAKAAGEEMPDEDPFDSNCITPGTLFMARLTKHLKYFITKKVSEDKEWQGVKVVLSGHEVPGEGEHKIMEYIRLSKAQPDYDANIRHCLYGLDADLIMLGLLSHDPHFCLLREEVSFGPSTKKQSRELEQQNFFLMHLSLLREYLEFEFQDLREIISFEYNLERIIDDFILLAFFVGNDFLPNLPNLHINEGALALMFTTYKKVLPQLDGYINEYGIISLLRLDVLLQELEEFEFRIFEQDFRDASWMKGKQKGHLSALDSADPRVSMTTSQNGVYNKVKGYVVKRKSKPFGKLDLPADISEGDRKFVSTLAKSFQLHSLWIQKEGEETRHLRLEYVHNEDGDVSEDEEAQEAISRVVRKWDKAVIYDGSQEDAEVEMEKIYRAKFDEWKDAYYWDKLKFHLTDEKAVTEMNENYVEGLQWVLRYYYHGVASWSWYYRYHFSPKISDVRKGLKANLDFALGTPFKPFEQLMGVLPERSKKLIPDAFKPLMEESTSPIVDFYPHNFELDMNGKKQAWEAVVKIPFIDENRLLAAMHSREYKLTDEERGRNTFGNPLQFSYAPSIDELFLSSLPGVFPDIGHSHCVMTIFDLPSMDGLALVVGLCEGVHLGENALAGFPSLKTLPHTAHLGFHKVQVFQLESRNETMVISIDQPETLPAAEQIAEERIDEKIFVGWPFLHESVVIAVSDELFRYEMKVVNGRRRLVPVSHSPSDLNEWRKKADRIELVHSKRMGVLTGPVQILIHVQLLKGLIRRDDGARLKDYGDVPGINGDYALQTVVEDVVQEDQRFVESGPVDLTEDFPIDAKAFFLGEFNYGSPLKVTGHRAPRIDIKLLIFKEKEPDFGIRIRKHTIERERYFPSYAVARMVQMHPLVLSKILSSFSVLENDQRTNLGLNLKFEAKKQKVIGYSRRTAAGWEFSENAVNLLIEYKRRFPDFFRVLDSKKNADVYSDTDFYPAEVAKEKFREIREWLKSISSKSFNRVSLDDEQFDADATAQIEGLATAFATSRAPPAPSQINGVPRGALLKPSECAHRLHSQVLALGERVVYVQESGKVPMGMRGTVVGTTKSATPTVDVLFDSNFLSGTTLDGRCSQYRGMTVAASAVLNLTTPQVLVDSKASSAKKVTTELKPAPPVSNAWRPSGGGRAFDGPKRPQVDGGALNGSLVNGGIAAGSRQQIRRETSRGHAANGTPRGRAPYDAQRYANGVGIPPPPELTGASTPNRGRGRGRGRGGSFFRGSGPRGQGTNATE